MKLMIIEKFPVAFIDLENIAAQSATDRVGYQHVVALDALLFGEEFDANEHRPPRILMIPKKLS